MSIEVNEFSEEWRGYLLFNKVIWFPYSLTINWAELRRA